MVMHSYECASYNPYGVYVEKYIFFDSDCKIILYYYDYSKRQWTTQEKDQLEKK